ncbi:tyrosine-type recombinase/integrase [Candidatus Bathyarchaeota archaeon]|nr:tyrosine-type recombinase/integrase [Candidatus Bathyarchaeota archaeon]
MREWLVWCRRNLAVDSVLQYSRVISQFQQYCNNPALSAVTLSTIEGYIDTRMQGRGHNTINSELMVIKSFWSWAANRYGVPNLAARVPRLTPNDPEQRFLSIEEYRKVLKICGPLERDMMQLYSGTGLRRGELLKLRWHHIAPDMRALRVPKGKGNKARTIPLNEICRDVLTRNRVDDTFSFLQRYGSPSGQNRLCGRLAGQAKIPPFGPHALRHRFATQMIRAGVPIKIVSKILGHSSIATTERIYLHLLPVDLLGTTDGLVE